MGERQALRQTTIAASRGRIVSLLRQPLYANAFFLWSNTTVSALAGFAFWMLAARLYSADDVGLASAALSALTLLAMFSHLDLGLGLIRFLPEAGGQGPRLVNIVFTTSTAIAVVLALVFLIGVPLWAPSLGFVRNNLLYASAFVSFVAATTVSSVQLHAYLSIRKAKYVLVQTLVVQASRLTLPALMAAFFGAFGLIMAGGVAVLLGAVLGFGLLIRGLPGYRPAVLMDAGSILKLLPFSLANHVADVLIVMPGLILPLIVVGLLGSEEGAYFYMAWFLGYLVTSATAHLALSLFAEGSRDQGSLLVLSRNAVAGGLAIATIGAVFLLMLGDKLLMLFGQEYATEGVTLLRIVAIAAAPAVIVNTYLGALRVMKRVDELVIIAGAVAVITLASSSALIPVMGLAGAGVGHGTGQGVGLAIVLGRLLTTLGGTLAQRVRWLLVTLVRQY